MQLKHTIICTNLFKLGEETNWDGAMQIASLTNRIGTLNQKLIDEARGLSDRAIRVADRCGAEVDATPLDVNFLPACVTEMQRVIAARDAAIGELNMYLTMLSQFDAAMYARVAERVR